MLKQELIEQINELRTCKGWNDKFADVTDMVSKENVLKLVEQLSEPKKVVIPKFVAKWIEDNKEKKMRLFDALMDSEAVNDWLDCGVGSNEDLFARAWLDGYEIESEKLYIVELPDPNNNSWRNTTLVRKTDGTIRIMMVDRPEWVNDKAHQLTEDEIKKDFKWAWDAGFAKEVLYEGT